MSETNTNETQEFDAQEVLNNPTLEGLATIVIDMVEMSQGQMQSNIVFSSLVNTVVGVLIEQGLTTEEEFSSRLEKSLTELEDQYNKSLTDFEKQNSEAKTSSEDLPKAPKENNDDENP